MDEENVYDGGWMVREEGRKTSTFTYPMHCHRWKADERDDDEE